MRGRQGLGEAGVQVLALRVVDLAEAPQPGETPVGVDVQAQVGRRASGGDEELEPALEAAFARRTSWNWKRTLDVAGLRVPLAQEPAGVHLRILADRRSLEVFGNGGRVAVSKRVERDPAARPLELHHSGDEVRLQAIQVHPLRSAW